jgi:hypothetical protein
VPGGREVIERERLGARLAAERERFVADNPRLAVV